MAALSRWQWFTFLKNHYELLYEAGMVSLQLAEARDYVARWDILKPLGDKLAPLLDELTAGPQSMTAVGTQSISQTNQEQQETFLIDFRNAYVAMRAGYDDPHRQALSSSQLGEAQSQFMVEAALFDHNWLTAALKVMELVFGLLNAMPKRQGMAAAMVLPDTTSSPLGTTKPAPPGSVIPGRYPAWNLPNTATSSLQGHAGGRVNDPGSLELKTDGPGAVSPPDPATTPFGGKPVAAQQVPKTENVTTFDPNKQR